MSFQQVCDNVGDHLIGNVYARYEWETEAQAAVDSCNERWYAGASPLFPSPFYMRPDASPRPTTLCRALPGDRLPRSLLPPERERRVQPRRLLQLHASPSRVEGPRLLPARRPAPRAPPQPIQGRDWWRRLGAHQARGRQGPKRKSPETWGQHRRGPMDEKVGLFFMTSTHLSSTKLHGIPSVILPSDAKYLHVCNKTESQFLYEPLFTA